MQFPGASAVIRVSIVSTLLLQWAPASAQTGAIAGRVTSTGDSSGVAFVNVFIRSSSGTTTTGRTSENGSFRVADIPAGTYSVEFRLAGWSDARQEGVTVRAGDTTIVRVSLDPSPYSLNPVTVTGGRRPERLLDAPASISVLDRNDVAAKPALTLLDQIEDVEGVDVIRTGLVDGYVSTRGFNRLSGDQLLLLTDQRIGQVPSLRANLPRVLPLTNLDIERIEVVRGPASALYGPNAADGVIQILTSSPIESPGLSISVGGGFREQAAVPGFEPTTGSVKQIETRLAHRFSDRFGTRISSRWVRGSDWRYRDPSEEQQRTIAEACLSAPSAQNDACRTFAATPGTLPDLGELGRIGNRDFDVEHWTVDTRTDWRPAAATSLVVSSGLEWTVNSLDQTAIGTVQTRRGITYYGQARFSRNALFAQAFFVQNDVGPETFNLRTGVGFADRSTLAVAQIQHSSELGPHRLVYGADLLATMPRTLGLINGVNEDEDSFEETGVYLQAETRLSPAWQLTAAARADYHSVMDDMVLSPRAAAVFTPAPGHNFRATFNRAFFTPGATQLFADLFAARIPLGPFSYGVRAAGTADGLTFRMIDGRPAMKSPFALLAGAGATSFLPSTTAQLYAIARELARAQDPALGNLLDLLGTPSESEVSPVLKVLDPTAGFIALDGGFDAVSDIPAIGRQTTSTIELGYKGLVDNRLVLAVDLHYTKKQNYIGGLRVETPNVFLNGEQLVRYFTDRGLDEQAARAIAIGSPEQPGLASIPLGVIQPVETSDPTPNLVLAARNFGDLDVFGAEISAELRPDAAWELGLAASWMSDDMFDADGFAVALNAPRWKSRVFVSRRDEATGIDGTLRYRFADTHPVAFGVFGGEIDAYHVVDLTLGYRFPGRSEVRIQMDVENLFDQSYRTFVGAPQLGRFVLARLTWSF